MYLIVHNAHMTLIQTPAVPADATKGISGAAAVTRWSGDVQAYIDEDIIDEIRGGQRFRVSRTLLDVPINLPVWPNEEDLVTIVRTGVVAQYSAAAPQTEVMKVRTIDGGFTILGKLRMTVVRS